MRTLLLFPLLLLSLCLQAQEEEKPKGLFRKIGHYISDIDTLYIAPNKYNLAFMLENSNWYENYVFRTTEEDRAEQQRLRISPNVNYRLGAYFGWKWIFVGYSIDLGNLSGKKKASQQRTEFGLSLYSSVAGCDLFYRKSGNDFKLRNTGQFRPDGYTGKLDRDVYGLSADIAGLNAYWILNHRRFSYPAAYSQSTNQLRNAGSVIIGFSFSKHKIDFDFRGLPDYVQEQLDDNLKFENITYSDFNLSAGYTYNWVFARHCLLNVSLAPALAYKKSKTDSKEQDFPILRNFNVDLVSRAGITYNNSKYYVGISMVMNTFGYRSDKFYATNNFGTIRIYAGFNFWKKKAYKDNQSTNKEQGL